jgi:esterase/lipase superfamily enzyme
VSILAHSMGNWVTLEALRQMAIRDGALPGKIGDVILAAPDVDVDVAVTQVRAMGPRLPRFTLFAARDDRALTVSRAVWGGTDRLGAIDPTQEPYRSTLARYRIAAVDLSGVSPSDPLRHDRFAESQVVGLIGRQLAGGRGIGGRPFGVGDQIGLAVTGAAATVGSAAGLVLTAPLAVVDPASRENFGERLETLLPATPRAPAPLEAVDLPDPPAPPAPRARGGRVSPR